MPRIQTEGGWSMTDRVEPKPLDLAALRAAEAAMTPAPWCDIRKLTGLSRANSDGIVAMRNAFPSLLNEVERLQAIVDRLPNGIITEQRAKIEQLRHDAEAFRAIVAIRPWRLCEFQGRWLLTPRNGVTHLGAALDEMVEKALGAKPGEPIAEGKQ